jgi:hypothetical protein
MLYKIFTIAKSKKVETEWFNSRQIWLWFEKGYFAADDDDDDEIQRNECALKC